MSNLTSVIDVDDYRLIVIEIIVHGKYVSKEVYELRLSLFIHAANCYFQSNYQNTCLEPFPSCFFDQDTKLRRYDDLEYYISTIPQLTDFSVSDFCL